MCLLWQYQRPAEGPCTYPHWKPNSMEPDKIIRNFDWQITSNLDILRHKNKTNKQTSMKAKSQFVSSGWVLNERNKKISMNLVMLALMEELRSEGVGNITSQGHKCRHNALGAVQTHYGDSDHGVCVRKLKIRCEGMVGQWEYSTIY